MLSMSKCGLYSSRSRQKWKEWEHVLRHAPDGWKDAHLEDDESEDVTCDTTSVVLSGNKGSIWARLLAKIYEVESFVCTQCGGEMKVIAVIMDSVEVKKILKHLVKTGKSPPGFCLDDSCAERSRSMGMVS